MNTFKVPLGVTVVTVIAATVLGGLKTGLIVALLAILEISISFDNAIVNAAVLKSMSPRWQQIFLTWGILIAVFGMRLVFPIVIVAAAAGISIPDVLDQALNRPDVYAHNLEDANAVIAAFGGTFLLMVFLGFFLDAEKESAWIRIERPMAGIGRIDSVAAAIAGGTLLVVSQLVSPANERDVLLAGLAGLVTHMLASGIADRLEPEAAEDPVPDGQGPSLATAAVATAAVTAVGKAGLGSFLYLELLDASFSFDGVIGAFAISKDIVVIAVGLGLGALYIRTLTVYLVRQGVLSEYRYLEHGAHWAIGVLAVLLFVGIEHHVPEVVTGLVGAALIGLAFISSVNAQRRDDAAAPDIAAPEAA